MPRIKLTNDADVAMAQRGIIRPDQVRSVEVDALVHTGAASLVLPAELALALGMVERGRRRVRYADGRVDETPWVGGVLVEILGREMVCGALLQPGATMPLMGQIPLEELDLVVDPRSRELRVNPESPELPRLAHPAKRAAL